MTINGYNDPTGELAAVLADKALFAAKCGEYSRKHTRGIEICKKAGCKRIVDNQCLGWVDPLYMWEYYTDCPHFSSDNRLVEKIDDAIRVYRGDVVG
jgi:hypothetical protein